MSLNKKGFTLIELLVVIAIIGVLSTLAVIALGNARTKARDSKRMSDLKQISSALELYYADNSTYPTIITPGDSLLSPDGTKTYMGKIPSNPSPRNDGDCTDADYVYVSDNSSYTIDSCLGSSVNNLISGPIFQSPSGFSSGPSCSNNNQACDARDCCSGFACSHGVCTCAGLGLSCDPMNQDEAPCCAGTHCDASPGFCIVD